MRKLTMFQAGVLFAGYHIQREGDTDSHAVWIGGSAFGRILGRKLQTHHYRALDALRKDGYLKKKMVYGQKAYRLTPFSMSLIEERIAFELDTTILMVYGHERELEW